MNLKSYKKDFDHSYSISVYPTLELLTYRPKSVIKVIISPRSESNEGVHKILDLCAKYDIQAEFSDILINKVGGHENSYAVGVFNKYTSPVDYTANHLMLINPSDTGNLGTICRTMLAFDITNLVIVSPAVDIFDPKVIRASMGAVFNLSFTYIKSFDEYNASPSRSLYAFTTNAESTLETTKFTKPYTVIFGNEGSGLPSDLKNVGTSVQIPQSDKVDSLNLAISVGIVLAKTFNDKS